MSHGSEVSALAIVTCDDLEPTYVYEFAAAAAAAATAAAASAYNYISLKFTLMQPTTMHCAFFEPTRHMIIEPTRHMINLSACFSVHSIACTFFTSSSARF